MDNTRAAAPAAPAEASSATDLDDFLREFQTRATVTGFTLRPITAADEAASLTDVVDCMFGVQRRALVWTRDRGATWHQHWSTHVVALRGALVRRRRG